MDPTRLPPNTLLDFSEKPGHTASPREDQEKPVLLPAANSSAVFLRNSSWRSEPHRPTQPTAPSLPCPEPSTSASPLREIHARTGSMPRPNAAPCHTKVREAPCPATLPRPALFCRPLFPVFSAPFSREPPAGSPSVLHSKSGEGNDGDGVGGARKPDCLPFRLGTDATEKKCAKPKIEAVRRPDHAAPFPQAHGDNSGSPALPPDPNRLFSLPETQTTPVDSSGPYAQKALSPPLNAGEKRPSWDRPLRWGAFSGGRAGPGLGRLGTLGLARFPGRKVKGDLSVLPHQKGRKRSACFVGNEFLQKGCLAVL